MRDAEAVWALPASVPAVCPISASPSTACLPLQINEAFASQFAYCVQALGIDAEKINPNGGALPVPAVAVRCLAAALEHRPVKCCSTAC